MLAAALCAFLAAAPSPSPVPQQVWWVFLVQGPKRDQSREWLEEGQKKHLANLGRLYELGLSPLAGPLGDDGRIRGIVLVHAASREELLRDFEPDPFVKEGRLAVEASPWTGSVASLRKAPEPYSMTAATVVRVLKTPKFSRDALPAHRQFMDGLVREGDPVLHGATPEGGDVLAVLLFREGDTAAVQRRLDADPAVKAGAITYEVHPQLLASGVLPPPAP